MVETTLKRSVAVLRAQGFPGFMPGDIVTSSSLGNALAGPIRWAESSKDGEPAERSHSMIYTGAGNLLTQNWRIVEAPLTDYVGATISVLHNPLWSREDRARFIAEARLHLGRMYDVPGIFGQLLTSLTGIQWFADHIQVAGLTYCSEFVCVEVRRHIDPGFMSGYESCQVDPDQQTKWCQGAGWKCRTMVLVE